MKFTMSDIQNTPQLTIHCVERVCERQNIKSKAKAIRKIQKAMERGMDSGFFPSPDRKRLEAGLRDNCTAIVYDGFKYILSSGGVCITAYSVWNDLGRKKRFDGKEKIRNVKKYEKFRVPALEIV